MEDFKCIVKMKTGGSVAKAIGAYEKRERKSEESSDIKQDKAIVKKGVKQHEAALHKGQPKTELKLKTGGRAKKAAGTVKKFEKASGEYGAKKTAADKKNIAGAKKFKPAFKCGGNVKKMQVGGMSGPVPAGPAAAAPSGAMGQISDMEKRRQLEKMARAKQYLGPAQQSELIKQDPRAAGLTVMRKKGGKIKKCADGGRFNSIDDDVRARAMKFVAEGAPQNTETAETPVTPAKPARRAKAAKLPMPDYSNEDLDRMGMNKDLKQPEFDREEHSPWMREYRKEEAKAKASTKADPEMVRKAYIESAKYAKSPRNLKRGGKAKKMMTGGTCS